MIEKKYLWLFGAAMFNMLFGMFYMYMLLSSERFSLLAVPIGMAFGMPMNVTAALVHVFRAQDERIKKLEEALAEQVNPSQIVQQ